MNGSRAGARWIVRGRVQGVGFRWFVARKAQQLGLTGWARNLPTGQVEVVAAGPPAAMAELDASLRAGPRLAHVEGVEKSEIPHHTIEAISFEIK